MEVASNPPPPGHRRVKNDHFFNFLGKYIYIETSSPRLHGHKAFLMSPFLRKPSTNGECFTFWFHMYGSGIGTLQIFLTTANVKEHKGGGRKMLWSLSGNRGNRWNKGLANIGTTSGTYQVLL